MRIKGKNAALEGGEKLTCAFMCKDGDKVCVEITRVRRVFVVTCLLCVDSS